MDKLTTINWHLTNRCNLCCKHCLYDSGKTKFEEMITAEIRRVIDEFASLNNLKKTINLYGGEPLLRDDIYEIIEYAASKGIEIGITTNINVNSEKFEKLLQSSVSRVSIDIDGSPQHHNWLRNKENHINHVIESFELLKKAGKYISSTCVLHNQNKKDIYDVLELGRKIGLKALSFYLFTPLGRGKLLKDFVIGAHEWLSIKKQISDWCKENHPDYIVVFERSYDKKENLENNKSLCMTGTGEVLDIRSDGHVCFCGLLIGIGQPNLGNVKEDSLVSILKKRKENTINITCGCSALALSQGQDINNLVDFRESEDNIVPVCPYNWDLLWAGNDPETRKKFIHLVEEQNT